MGSFNDSVFDLKTRIKNKSAGIDVALKINPELINTLSIELKGNDISKDLITFSLPKSMKGASSFMDTSMNLGLKNSIYFNYSVPSSNLSGRDLKVKILINESQLALKDDLIIELNRPMIEADSKNLYVFSDSGKAANFFYDQAYGLVNYKTQNKEFFYTDIRLS